VAPALGSIIAVRMTSRCVSSSNSKVLSDNGVSSTATFVVWDDMNSNIYNSGLFLALYLPGPCACTPWRMDTIYTSKTARVFLSDDINFRGGPPLLLLLEFLYEDFLCPNANPKINKGCCGIRSQKCCATLGIVSVIHQFAVI
jgi:hypothetical protein